MISANLLTLLLVCTQSPTLPSGSWVLQRSVPSDDAIQAAAADEKHLYAVNDGRVAQHDRATGKLLRLSSGEAEHLNSAWPHAGGFLLAHSNYPKKPDTSDIRRLDPLTMKLEVFHSFENPPGSLTWVIPQEDGWWCHFAHYKGENGKSLAIRYDRSWKEKQRWTYPEKVVRDWDGMSLSGMVRHRGMWLGTPHTAKKLYVLDYPASGDKAALLGEVAAPFTGQGIGPDPVSGGLVGIDRKNRQILLAGWEEGKK